MKKGDTIKISGKIDKSELSFEIETKMDYDMQDEQDNQIRQLIYRANAIKAGLIY